jgi:hypothetical protein
MTRSGRAHGLIDAEAFEACFTEWAKSQAESSPDGEAQAIDGKTIRRSFDHGKEQSPLHVVSAWASSQSLVLAQEAQEEKSNEITAIPEVLEAIELEGALVTIDAMGCQIDIAEEILEEKADYLLALKANHETDYRAVQAHFEERCFGSGAFDAEPSPGFEAMGSTTLTAGSCVAGCSPARKPLGSRPFRSGRGSSPSLEPRPFEP